MCAGKNRRFAESAIRNGWLYGSQLPATVYAPIVFADQDYKKPRRAQYMAALAQHRPETATVLDLEHEHQLETVLSWAEEAAQWARRVVIIPKASGIIARLPRCIGGADVVLGYSVPTRYGGTTVPIWEFAGWPLHLLGGSPHAQMAYWCILHNTPAPAWFSPRLQRFVQRWRMFGGQAEVVSADGNMASTMANGTRYNPAGAFWRLEPGLKGHWVNLKEIGRGDEHDAPYTAFELSMQHIMEQWQCLQNCTT
jgi:hypothetical protein